MPYSSRSHLKNSRLANVWASVLPSLVLFIQDSYWDKAGVLSFAPGYTGFVSWPLITTVSRLNKSRSEFLIFIYSLVYMPGQK
jgi:hypothetical protein